MECKFLWFIDASGKQHRVKGGSVARKDISNAILGDLKIRRPRFISYYQRYNEMENGDVWIDFGSHTEFYIWR